MAQTSTPVHRRPGRGVAILAGLLEEADVDPVPLLRDAGLDPKTVRFPDALVSADSELHFVASALAASPWPDIGLRAGLRHHFALFGAWGLAMVSSPNLESAIRVGLRHMALVHTYLDWSMHGEQDRAVVEFRVPSNLHGLDAYFIERDAAAAITLVTGLLGTRPDLLAVEFPHAEPQWSAAYRRVFDAPLAFGSDRGRMIIDARWLRRPLPQANPGTAAAANHHCAMLLERMHAAGPLAERVRNRLLRSAGPFPNQTRLAADMHMSERTFRRRLEAEGLSFRDLRDEVRRELTESYLVDTGLTLGEIAGRVGFSDAANLSHACRRWFGCTPGAYRRARAAENTEDTLR
jgi:AraC-like DNA-binding protein